MIHVHIIMVDILYITIIDLEGIIVAKLAMISTKTVYIKNNVNSNWNRRTRKVVLPWHKGHIIIEFISLNPNRSQRGT